MFAFDTKLIQLLHTTWSEYYSYWVESNRPIDDTEWYTPEMVVSMIKGGHNA